MILIHKIFLRMFSDRIYESESVFLRLQCVVVWDLIFPSAGFAFQLRSVFALRVNDTGDISGSFWETCKLVPIIVSNQS